MQQIKERAGTIYTVVEAVVLAISVILVGWTANKCIWISEIVSMHGNQIVDVSRRVDKLEAAALLSATVPGRIDALNARMDAFAEGQKRIELLLQQHIDKK